MIETAATDKDLTQWAQRNRGEKSEKDKGVWRRDAEGAEKGSCNGHGEHR